MSDRWDPRAQRSRNRRMRAVNVPMRAVLSLPFPTPLGRRLMLAYLTGRRTGRHFRQPLAWIRDRDGVLITPGGGKWTANVLDGRPVRLRVRGSAFTAIPEFVTEPARVEELLDTIGAASRVTASFVPLPRTPDGHLEPEPLATAVRHGFGIVRWHNSTGHPRPTDLR